MDNQLRTELGDLLRRDVEGGAFRSVEHAVSLLHAQESWLTERRAESQPPTTPAGSRTPPSE